MSTLVAMPCRCGGEMVEGVYCENCDRVQPQEKAGVARRKTPQDVRFNLYWAQEIAAYKDNTRYKKGRDSA